MVLIVLAVFLAAVAWLIVFSSGAVIAWRGLRGRRLDDHPRCRRCGYILVGATLPQRCSECGSVLGGPRTIRRSPRRRRWSSVVSGAVTMLFCIGLLGLTYVFPSGRAPVPAVPAVAPVPATTRQRPVAARSVCPRCGGIHGWTVISLTKPLEPACTEEEGSGETEPAQPQASVDESDLVRKERDDQRWYNLRTIGGCCPHCGRPVMSPSLSPLCPQCGVDLSKRK